MENETVEEFKKAGLGGHYIDHKKALFYTDATDNSWTSTYIQSKVDAIADLHEDMAAEQKGKSNL